MNKKWSVISWNEYLYWQQTDKKIVKRINDLIKDIERNGALKGKGEPEALKYRKGYSRRINHEHRLVYLIEGNDLLIVSCKGHYED